MQAEGLGQVSVETRRVRMLQVLGQRVAGHGDEKCAFEHLVGPKGARHIVAGHPGKTHVTEHDLRMEAPGQGQPSGAVMRHGDLVCVQLERLAQAVGGVDVVLDDQHAPASDGVAGDSRLCWCGLDLIIWETHHELGSLACSFAVCANVATVELDQLLGQCEPQTEPSLAAIERRFPLHEGLEQMCERLFGHTGPAISHDDGRMFRRRICGNANPGPASPARELGRVAQQVAHYLGQPCRVGIYQQWLRRQLALDRDSILLEERAMVVDSSTNQIIQLNPPPLKPDLASADARDVEQVVDQPGQVLDLAIDHGIRASRLLTAWDGSSQHIQTVANRRQRVAQFVREHGHELVLAPVRLPQLGFALA